MNPRIDESIWNNLHNTRDHFKKSKIKVHVPCCVGYADAPDNFAALVRDLEERRRLDENFSYEIILYPNERNPEAVKAWCERHREVLSKNRNIHFIEDWEKGNENYQNACRKFDVYYGEHPDILAKHLEADGNAFINRVNKKLPEEKKYTLEEAKSTIERKAKHTLAWAEPKESEVKTTQHFILFSDDLSGLMKNMLENLDQIGYVRDSLQRKVLKFAYGQKNDQTMPAAGDTGNNKGTTSQIRQVLDLDRLIIPFAKKAEQANINPQYAATFARVFFDPSTTYHGLDGAQPLTNGQVGIAKNHEEREEQKLKLDTAGTVELLLKVPSPRNASRPQQASLDENDLPETSVLTPVLGKRVPCVV